MDLHVTVAQLWIDWLRIFNFCISIDAFNKPLRLLHIRMFPAQSWELAIIGEWLGYRKATVFTPSHALDAKFSLIIVGWWRLRISDGKFVKHTTEMILWSMILTSVNDRQPTHESLTFFHKLILFSKLEHSCVWLWTWLTLRSIKFHGHNFKSLKTISYGLTIFHNVEFCKSSIF